MGEATNSETRPEKPEKPEIKPLSIVYVLQDDGSKNLFPATRFGKIMTFSRHDMPMFNDDWIDELAEWLSMYDPKVDYLLLTGDPVLIGVACALIGGNHDQLRVLKWDRQEKRYIPLTYGLEG